MSKTPRGAQLIVLALGLGIVGLLVNAVVSYRNLAKIADNKRREIHAQQILDELQRMLSLITDAETGQRGFLLTSDTKYLEPYSAAIDHVRSSLRHIKELTAENPTQQNRLAQLEPKVSAKLAELESTVQLAKDQNQAAALETVKTDRGKKEMDDIHDIVRQIEQDERKSLTRRGAESDRSLQESRLTLLLASAAVLALLCATAIGVRQYLHYRQQAEARLRGERKRLEVTLSSIGDAVIATDYAGKVAFLNPTAAALTGWSDTLARGTSLSEVFRIVNERTRAQVESPVTKALREGIVVGLANHTLLLARDGTERPIDDSAAPIFDEAGDVFGVVLVFRDATEKRRAQEALQKLATIVEHSDDAIISKTMDGTITSWNAAAERLLGFTAGEAIGQPISIIVPEDHREELAHIMQKLRAGERVRHFDTVRRRKDGTLFHASLQISPILDSYGEVVGASKSLRDITERKKSEDSLALLASASRGLSVLTDRHTAFQRAAEVCVPSLADWCVAYSIDHDGNIRYQACAHRNPAQQRLLQEMLENFPLDWSSSAISVRVLRTGRTEHLDEITEPVLASMGRTEEEREALRGLHPRSMIGAPLITRAGIIGATTFVISESNRRYDALDVALAEELTVRLATAIDNADLFNSVKQADRQKDEFLAMLAHELRNPLATIKYATTLAQMPSAESKDEMFAMIERQVTNLARLIDDLLDVSRISQDKIQLKRELVDASTLAKRAAADVSSLVEQKRHRFTINIAEEPMPLHADPTRVEQIIANLLNNAAKYTPDGGQVHLTVFPENGSVNIKVKDTGVGIPPEMLPRVFDLFTQLDRTLDRSEGGLGIGLTVARKLAEMHGGTVSVESQGLGHGSVFTVCLPLSTAPRLLAAPPKGSESAAKSSLRIVVVDDNRDTARTEALWLRAIGHDVREAYDGPSALDTAREFRPKVVLLDIGLPGMNGYEVAQNLRREGFDKEVLVAVSGYGQAEDRRRSKEAGFDHHLVKPVDHEALAALLQEIAGH